MSEAAKHTPGPWNDGIYRAVTDGGRTYAYIRATGFLVPIAAVPLGVEGYGREEGEANARLIAAAPEMKAELEVRVGDLVMLRRAIEEGDPKAELLIRVGDMLRETRACLSRAESTLPADRKE